MRTFHDRFHGAAMFQRADRYDRVANHMTRPLYERVARAFIPSFRYPTNIAQSGRNRIAVQDARTFQTDVPVAASCLIAIAVTSQRRSITPNFIVLFSS